jgi:cytochrome b pre-mRNA-processing protein 3
MMFHFFRRNPHDRTIASLYGMIVAQARAVPFYSSYGVPDTVSGRFEMVVLHAVLLLHRLESEPASLRRLGQALFERFCQDMDGSLREMGVGDLAVPAKMRKIGEAFYGRQAAYVAALAACNREPLVAALARNVFGAQPGAQLGAIRLATYARAVADELADQDGEALGRAELNLPDPERIMVAGATPSGEAATW